MAIIVLTLSFLGWASGMITATQAQNKAQEHTLAIAIADRLMERMRRDPFFWTDTGAQAEWSGASCTSGDCWTSNVNVDPCGNAEPPYNDVFGTTAPHDGCRPAGNADPPFQYLWRADPHAAWQGAADTNAADISVWVFITVDGRKETYHVVGLMRKL